MGMDPLFFPVSLWLPPSRELHYLQKLPSEISLQRAPGAEGPLPHRRLPSEDTCLLNSSKSLPSPITLRESAANTWSRWGTTSGVGEAGIPGASKLLIRRDTHRAGPRWASARGDLTGRPQASVSRLARNTLCDSEQCLNFRALMSNCERPFPVPGRLRKATTPR